MRSSTDRWTYRFDCDTSAVGDAFLARVAIRVASQADPGGMLVERAHGATSTTVVPHQPIWDAAIRGCAVDLAGRLTRRPASLLEVERAPPSGALAFLIGATDRGRPSRPGTRSPDLARGGLPSTPLAGARCPVLAQSHWFSTGDGTVRAWTRLTGRGAVRAEEVHAAALAIAARTPEEAEVRAVVRPVRRRDRREWVTGALVHSRAFPPAILRPCDAPSLLPEGRCPGPVHPEAIARPTVVVGASGSGKTAWLARLAATRISSGTSVVVFDVHGDLAPAVVAHLSERSRRRVIAIDADRPAREIPGLSLLDRSAGGEARAADVVAALKRLSASEGELYWGFRLERIFDTLVRAVQDEGGTLLDLLALLTEERRREATRIATRRPEVARFLDELPAILRRTPDFLWPAASRLTKVALDPRLAALVAPVDDGIPLLPWVDEGGSVLWRLPMATLGPEGASLAGSLLATRVYLALARRPPVPGRPRRVLLVIDEAHTLSPRLLTEILAEGRKFGVGFAMATQYPERMAPELRHAAAGAAATHVVFRVPPASTREIGSWAGLTEATAQLVLPNLSIGNAVWSSAGRGVGRLQAPPMPMDASDAWGRSVALSVERLGLAGAPDPLQVPVSEVDAILLALVDGPTGRRPMARAALVARLSARESEPVTPDQLSLAWPTLRARGWVDESSDGVALTAAGERYLGIGGATHAPRESAEHRALLTGAARIFARHGLPMELVRQGRFDTRLPDGIVRQLGPGARSESPRDVAARIDQRRGTWAWRTFGGLDLYIEAEVSGAERRSRILHGLRKAERAEAAVVFVVGDARRAGRVRAVLHGERVPIWRGQVWTLRIAR